MNSSIDLHGVYRVEVRKVERTQIYGSGAGKPFTVYHLDIYGEDGGARIGLFVQDGVELKGNLNQCILETDKEIA